MKSSLLLSALLTLAPVAALAQGAPPPGPPMDGATPSAAVRAQMEQVRAQSEQLRLASRTRMLASLTPQHRALIANVVGQLAIAANPDPRAAAQVLDAALAPVEKQSVLSIHTAERSNMEALMQQARAAAESSMSAEQRASMEQHRAQMQSMRPSGARPVEDAGEILLRSLTSFGHPPMPGGRPM